MRFSKLASNLYGNVIRDMFDEALKMTDTISFTVGEPDFITPAPIIEEAVKRWKQGLTHYTPNTGIPKLRQAIAKFHEKEFSVDPDSEIMVSCGAAEAIQMAMFALVDPGDEVVLVTPAWPNFFGQIAMTGAKLVSVPAREENYFVPDPDDIKKAITDKTKMVIINSPSNPTGAVIDPDTAKEIADILRERDVYVISDEIYSRLIHDGKNTSITSFEGLREKTVYINGFSKMFAMTGWRLGYAIADARIIRNMTRLHESGVSCLPAPTQYAAAYAMEHGQIWIDEMEQSYRTRRDLLCSLIDAIPGISVRKPKGAFYAFCNVKPILKATGMNSKEFCMDLLKKTGVVIIPGSGFGEGGEGYVRITYATSEENIRRGMGRLKEYVSGKGEIFS